MLFRKFIYLQYYIIRIFFSDFFPEKEIIVPNMGKKQKHLNQEWVIDQTSIFHDSTH